MRLLLFGVKQDSEKKRKESTSQSRFFFHFFLKGLPGVAMYDKVRGKRRKKAGEFDTPKRKNPCKSIITRVKSAQNRIRTYTRFPTLRPEHSASTNFAIWASNLLEDIGFRR